MPRASTHMTLVRFFSFLTLMQWLLAGAPPHAAPASSNSAVAASSSEQEGDWPPPEAPEADAFEGPGYGVALYGDSVMQCLKYQFPSCDGSPAVLKKRLGEACAYCVHGMVHTVGWT